jgi:hypothetical protein
MIGLYFKAGLSALGAAGLLTKVLMAGGLAISLWAAYEGWHHKVYKEGWNAHLAAVVRADTKVVERASKLRGVLLSCEARNLEWDQTTGGCK